MKYLLPLILFILTFPAVARVESKRVQDWILESIDEMPKEGGYVLSSLSSRKLRDSFTWKAEDLLVSAHLAVPSYCTTATYIVFYKTLEKYWAFSRQKPAKLVLEKLKPKMENDGTRIWGRWNSNGPGTAKFFFDARIGKNFEDISLARPGDFLKIFWNTEVGKLEKGHSVIYLGQETRNGVPMIRFWGSSLSTYGYSERVIARSEAKRLLFSRLDTPEHFERLAQLPDVDPFLASMLTRVSSWDELKAVSGIKQ